MCDSLLRTTPDRRGGALSLRLAPGVPSNPGGTDVGGKKVGELDVYFNRATGKNCAKMNHAGKTWGKALKTRVWIGICSERKPGGKTCHYNARTDAVDVGTYKYFAGPATTKTSARGRCIAASGYLWMNGKRHVVSTQPWVGHCG